MALIPSIDECSLVLTIDHQPTWLSLYAVGSLIFLVNLAEFQLVLSSYRLATGR